jgi:hypothetical protein
MSLGALTRGDRRASTVVDFQSFDVDSRSGHKAMGRMIDAVKQADVAEVELALKSSTAPPLPLEASPLHAWSCLHGFQALTVRCRWGPTCGRSRTWPRHS